MNDLPLLSVIVPVYNVETYLDRCIGSLVEQTYSNLEIFLVDDGSADGSGGICDAWAARDSRIHVIHTRNRGAGAARNLALDLAKGALIGFVDSDDYIHPNMYRRLYGMLTEDVDIAECDLVVTEEDHCSLDDGHAGNSRVYPAVEAMRLHIRDEAFCQTIWNKLYRREMIGPIRFPEGHLIDDEFWAYQVIGNARALARCTDRMYAYRQQTGSVMHRKYSLARLEGVRAKQQRLEYLKVHIPQLVEEAKRDLYFTCVYAMQGSLRFLPKEDRTQARTVLCGAVKALKPISVSAELSLGKNLLVILGQISLVGVSRILNFLVRIHVLT